MPMLLLTSLLKYWISLKEEISLFKLGSFFYEDRKEGSFKLVKEPLYFYYSFSQELL